MFQVGDVIGSYTILAHLRTGGMASLYLARRTGAAGFARLVAIKVVHPRLSEDSGLIRMFVDEAKLTARIEHPNVVHVEELGESEGTYYLVMEYVHGCSLAQLMRSLGRSKRRLSPLVAVAICARVAEGLHAAHETTGDDGQLLNIVHRDVSPQNILLSHRGHVKLIDFGIAKAKLDRGETNTKSLKGKVRYMAPEQATTGRVDRRTDLYALGIVLWELLTMRRLFSGRTEFEILMQVRKPRVVPPSRYATEIPAELDAVVMRALSTSPDERFANAKELRRQLVRALPRAAGIDSAHLADLLVNVVGDALDQERHELPQDVSRVLRAEQQRVVGLEKQEREKSAEQPLDEPAVAAANGVVDAYTLHSGELQYEDESPSDGRDIDDDTEDSGEAAPTERAQRPPAEAFAPRTAIPIQTPDPSRRPIVAPQVTTAPEDDDEDDSPTDVSDEAPVIKSPLPPPLVTPAAVIARPPIDPANDPFRSPDPITPEPRPQDRSLLGYGVALGASMAIGVALALWAPSCEREAATAVPTSPTPETLPVAAPAALDPALAAPPPAPVVVTPSEPSQERPVVAPRPRTATTITPPRPRDEAITPPPVEPPPPRETTIVGGVPIARDLQ
ncbi:protein kinase domain-containing protein [Sandaracinus amylolyticus]|uniref:protein kinase domain-containing protein n=1 Tax=Sandaracinus amylolyticus TaxID=927083 RepID=UPI001F2E4F4E|nr:serine/threonine-protein kinase [Sandaracinus amylolyticus]UJR78190.1 Serine/threonine protein kinase PrkC, regulator of stationary phase [Sandaracinus amylolyticus]